MIENIVKLMIEDEETVAIEQIMQQQAASFILVNDRELGEIYQWVGPSEEEIPQALMQ